MSGPSAVPGQPAEPPPPVVPPTVGPFTVLGVLRAEPQGQLVRARDIRAREVDLVLLSGAAGEDPAARDRFIGTAEAIYRQDPASVLGGSPAGSHAWVALPSGTGDQHLDRLLGAADLASDDTRRGPDFDPYWRGRTARPWWQEGFAYWGEERVRRPWWRYWWAILIALIMLILLLLLLSQCQPAPSQPSPTSGSPTSSGSSSAPSSSSGSSSPSSPSSSGSQSPTTEPTQSPTTGSTPPPATGPGGNPSETAAPV